MTRAFLCLLSGFAFCFSDTVLADDSLPLSLIRIPDAIPTVFIAETSTARFHRFDRTNGRVVYNGANDMSIGTAGAGKVTSGDKRTPLGAYFVTEQLDTSRLHEKYGVTAFPLDYPNVWDRKASRDGDGIWLHGVDPAGGKRPEKDTDGCIALGNDDLSTLSSRIEDNITPVLVLRAVDWGDPADNEVLRTELESSIADWAHSQGNGDLHAYLSSYDESFERWGMNKDEWAAVSMRSAHSKTDGTVTVSDLMLVRYPEEAGIYLSRFQLQVARKASTTAIASSKRLYWRRDAAGVLKIVAEDDG